MTGSGSSNGKSLLAPWHVAVMMQNASLRQEGYVEGSDHQTVVALLPYAKGFDSGTN